MFKLLYGVAKFRENLTEEYRAQFKKLALEQKPDALLISCSDSRVVPNLFASADPGDLFVVRNVGNIIPTADAKVFSEMAALEFAIESLHVDDIIVCGHSECGAMQAAISNASISEHFQEWLGFAANSKNDYGLQFSDKLSPVNQLSQNNVLRQLENLKTYSFVREKIMQEKLRLHAWWFDIARADLYDYRREEKRFVLLDQQEVARLVAEMTHAV